MTASGARVPQCPPCARRAYPRAIAPGISPGSADFDRAAPPLLIPAFPLPEEAEVAAADPKLFLPPLAPRDPQLHPVSLPAPCQSKFPRGRAPWIPHCGQRIRLPCTSKLPPSRMGSLLAVQAGAQFPSCQRRSVRSSKYSLAECLLRFPPEAFDVVHDFAAQQPLHVWQLLAQQYIYPVPRQSRAASFHPAKEEILPLHPRRRPRRSA